MSQALVVAALVSSLAATPAAAAQKPAMPPGMTPEIMKMMQTMGEPHPKGLPEDLVPVSGCIPSMGYHYAAPKNWPLGPIYGYYEGKPIFTEIMPTVKQLNGGFNVNDALKPLPGYTIDHVDVWYEPQGHPGLTVPHYDIHAWYIPHSQHMTFCKNTSGKRPAFV